MGSTVRWSQAWDRDGGADLFVGMRQLLYATKKNGGGQDRRGRVGVGVGVCII